MTTQEERDLEDKLTNEAKPGDQWLRYHSYSFHSGTYTVLTVTKTTKARINFDNNEAIMKSTRAIIGGLSSRTYFYPATEARLLEKANQEREEKAKGDAKKALETLNQKINRDSTTQDREDFVALANKFLAEHP